MHRVSLKYARPLQERNRAASDEFDLSNLDLDGVCGGLTPVQRLDLINRKIKPDARSVFCCEIILLKAETRLRKLGCSCCHKDSFSWDDWSTGGNTF